MERKTHVSKESKFVWFGFGFFFCMLMHFRPFQCYTDPNSSRKDGCLDGHEGRPVQAGLMLP